MPRKKQRKPTGQVTAAKDVILLKDLAPRTDVVGGAGKLRFGEPRPPKAQRKSPKR